MKRWKIGLHISEKEKRDKQMEEVPRFTHTHTHTHTHLPTSFRSSYTRHVLCIPASILWPSWWRSVHKVVSHALGFSLAPNIHLACRQKMRRVITPLALPYANTWLLYLLQCIDSISIYLSIYLTVCVCQFVYVCVCVYVCMCACICVCNHTVFIHDEW